MWKLIFIVSLFFNLSCLNKMYVNDFIYKPYKIQQKGLNESNFNGAYYQIDNKNKKLDVYFFYKNCIQRSITMDSNNFQSNSIPQSINKVIRQFKTDFRNSDQYFEDGGYFITNSEIVIQSIRYIPQFGWGVVTYKGKIIDDSTILITEYQFPKRAIFKRDSLYYHFINVEKPDSLKGDRWKEKEWFWQKE